MDSALRIAVLVVAALAIAVGVLANLRPSAARAPQGAQAAPEGRRRVAMDRVWTLVPIAFLALLVALTAAR